MATARPAGEEAATGKPDYSALSDLEKTILKRLLLVQRIRPPNSTCFNALYYNEPGGFLRTHTERQVQGGLDKLLQHGLIRCRQRDDYGFTRDQYLGACHLFRMAMRWDGVKKWWASLWQFVWKHFIVTVVTAAIVAAVTTLVTMWLAPPK